MTGQEANRDNSQENPREPGHNVRRRLTGAGVGIVTNTHEISAKRNGSLTV